MQPPTKWAETNANRAEWVGRGGLDDKPYAWGDAPPGMNGKWPCNIWQGEFPARIRRTTARHAPVKSLPPNGYGLYDRAGNVWEWCHDWYDRELHRSQPRTVAVNPQGPEISRDPARPFTPQRVQKGGSFLCNDTYCTRYRPSARHGCTPDTGMAHVGFGRAANQTIAWVHLMINQRWHSGRQPGAFL